MRILVLLGLLAASCGFVHETAAADPAGGTPVVVVVKVARPWYAPDFLVVRKMREALPAYRRLPGLRYKIFTLARPDGEFGGIYLWQDRAAADAWFTPAWYARVRQERGVEPGVRMFPVEAVYVRERPEARTELEGEAVATMVSASARVDRLNWAAESVQARIAPGLLRFYDIVEPRGGVGRLYLWRTERDAERWFDAVRQSRLRTIARGELRIEWFDAPVLMPGTGSPVHSKDAAKR
jgi:hypothetical protein